MPDFESFGKIPRLSRDIVVTEKIDGTNGQILIREIAMTDFWSDGCKRVLTSDENGLPRAYEIFVGSRKRWITPADDNYGFADWVYSNAYDLLDVLGEGRHYGEWWGRGIQRNYGMSDRRFSLFNTKRWVFGEMMENSTFSNMFHNVGLDIVPILYSGPFSTEKIEWVLDELRLTGSYAAPGFDNPEGVIVYHSAANMYFKKTIHKDEAPKSQESRV